MSTSKVHQYRFWGGLSDFSGIKAFRGDDQVTIHPIGFSGNEKTGHMRISHYWPAILDKSADAVIIIGNANIHSTWLMAIIARLMGKKVFFWAHGWRRPESSVKTMLRSIYYGLADQVLLYGHRAKSLAKAAGFPAEKLTVIYNSLDWDTSRPIDEKLREVSKETLRLELALPVDRPVLVCSARLIPACRFDLLIDAAARMKERGQAVTIALVGDGPEREHLEAQAQRLGVDARFFGAIYEETKLARIYHAADVTVSPGKVGLTAMHSMTYGVPVITHGNLDDQMPEVEAIEEGRTGALFKQNDVTDLADVISDWLARTSDARTVGEACRQVIETRYNPHRQAELIDAAVSKSLA